MLYYFKVMLKDARTLCEFYFIPVHSFVELATILLKMEGVEYVLSEKLNQDPLEEHFGKHRSKLGGSDNPTLQQYMQSEKKIIVGKSHVLTTLRGNTRGKLRSISDVNVEDEEPLPKRHKLKK